MGSEMCIRDRNIVNNFTNIQNFSNQKDPKNVHVYKMEDSIKSKPVKNIFNVEIKKHNVINKLKSEQEKPKQSNFNLFK